MLVSSITQLIGRTPIVDVSDRFEDLYGRLFVKVESFNPGGSVKDRIALGMVEDALKDGRINKQTHIVEPTSGNTGVGLAMVCAALGLKLTLVMPDTMTVERRMLIGAYGAHLVLTPGAQGMKGSIAKALEIKESEENSFMPMQFDNPSNPAVHRRTTALEILEDLPEIDVFVSGVGTGGTLSGTASIIKKHRDVEIVAVEPEKSPMISQGTAGPHKIYGIGAGFIPNNLDTELIDTVVTISDEDAYMTTRVLARQTGILAGVSSGGAFYVGLQMAKDPKYQGKNILVILPDTGERYLSSGVFAVE